MSFLFQDLSSSLEKFIENRQEILVGINEREFQPQNNECSRTSAQCSGVKSVVVDNSDGSPFSRYTNKDKPVPLDDVNARLKNLEQRLGAQPALGADVYARLKVLENKILKLEEMYPQIAAHTLSYEEATDQRQAGRLTKAPGFYRGLRVSKKQRRNAPLMAPIGIAAEAEQGSEILASRMEALKKKLLK